MTAYKKHVQTPAYLSQARFEVENFQMDASKSLEASNASMTLLFERANITDDYLKPGYNLRAIADEFHRKGASHLRRCPDSRCESAAFAEMLP